MRTPELRKLAKQMYCVEKDAPKSPNRRGSGAHFFSLFEYFSCVAFTTAFYTVESVAAQNQLILLLNFDCVAWILKAALGVVADDGAVGLLYCLEVGDEIPDVAELLGVAVVLT